MIINPEGPRVLHNCIYTPTVKVNIKIISILMAVVALFSCGCSRKTTGSNASSSPVPTGSISGATAAPGDFIDSLSIDWKSWQRVAVNGKLKMAGLPLSPSVKLYMEYGSKIYISLRAPFVGEAGRIEITPETILAVNKMGKVYVEEPLEQALAYYPGTISDLQELLLGRIVIPGKGLLSHKLEKYIDLYPESEGACAIVPNEKGSIKGVNYGYSVDPMEGMMALVVLPEALADTRFSIEYLFYDKGYDMTLRYKSPEKSYQADLQMDEPDWEGSGFEPISLGGKYKKVNFSEFLKSF